MAMKKIIRNLVIPFAFIATTAAHADVIVNTSLTNTTPVDVCDLCTVTSDLTYTSHDMVTDVNVLINDLIHSYDADLTIALTHNNQTVILANRLGGSSGANYTNTVFDDAALQSISVGNVYAPFTGTFSPASLLSAFNGMDAFGLWTLTVTDNEEGDSGTLNSWGLNITAVPEANGLALIVLGLLGVAARRRLAK
jgi:subtilisin-like proprotein convertase family protein